MRRGICMAGWLSSVLFSVMNVSAQDTLPVVVISALPLRNSMPGERTEQWNQADLRQFNHRAASDLLARESSIYVKTYSPGSLATLTTRGGSSSQTAVIWNGLPLQSPMVGLTDAALLPGAFVDGMSVYYGGNSAQWGNSAVGGVVALHNRRPEPDNGWQVRYSGAWGSFSTHSQLVSVATGRKKWSTHTRLLWQEAKNDFPYRKKPDLPLLRQTNSQFGQKALLQEFYRSLGATQELVLRAWAQQTRRSIPPVTTQTRNEATQADDFLRLTLHWKARAGKALLAARTGYFTEYIDYRDPMIRLVAKSHFSTWMAETEMQWQGGRRWKIHTGTFHSYQIAAAEGYRRNNPSENRQAVFAALRYQHGRGQAQLNLRQEWVDGRKLPLMPGYGMDFQIHKNLKINLKIVRNFRSPTLNDRYWQPGGKSDLLPESGWSQEIGLAGTTGAGLHYSCTAYHRLVRNWIMWSIAEGQSFWSSNNITRVRSQGIEQRMEYKKIIQTRHTLVWKGGYDLTQSTNQVALRQPALGAGQQLPYTPLHQGFVQCGWQYLSFEIYYTHRFTSKVQGINENITGFNLGFLSLQYTVDCGKKRKTPVHFFLQCDNVWNRSYRIIERRPMPGIAFRGGGGIAL